MDDRRKSPRVSKLAVAPIVRLVLDDESRQLGIIDDMGEGGACIELNGVVTQIAAGDVVGIEHDAKQDGTPLPEHGRIVWITGRHLGLQFLAGHEQDD